MKHLVTAVTILTNPRGAHNAQIAYEKMDEVQHETSLFVAAESIPAGVPITDPRWVKKLDNSSAYTAEQTRKAAEENRVENEETRVSNEENRVTNEDERVRNESIRPKYWYGTQEEYDALTDEEKNDLLTIHVVNEDGEIPEHIAILAQQIAQDAYQVAQDRDNVETMKNLVSEMYDEIMDSKES